MFPIGDTLKRLLFVGFIVLAACDTATAPKAAPLLVFDGNSLVDTGIGQVTWVTMVTDSLQGIATANFGLGGQATPQMLADVSPQVTALFRQGVPNVYVVWEVTNDLFYGASADSAYAHIAGLARGLRARGWRVIVLTPIPRGNATGDWEARRQVVLERMRADWRTFADELVDVAADPMLGSYSNLDDLSLFLDRVHLGSEGAKRVAALALPAVRRQIALH